MCNQEVDASLILRIANESAQRGLWGHPLAQRAPSVIQNAVEKVAFDGRLDHWLPIRGPSDRIKLERFAPGQGLPDHVATGQGSVGGKPNRKIARIATIDHEFGQPSGVERPRLNEGVHRRPVPTRQDASKGVHEDGRSVTGTARVGMEEDGL